MPGSMDARKMSLLLLIIFVSLEICESANLQRAYGQRGAPSDEVILLPKKRPFCNAFTGCSGKRSGRGAPGVPLPELVRQRQLAEEASLNGVVDLYPRETAAEDISGQLADASMWEALQEASAELNRRRFLNYQYAFNTQ